MDAIKSYIDHMFRGLPNNGEVKRARSELQTMCEDRYGELRDEGMSEHEAVGRVITQFGDLDEVADELGIRREVDGRSTAPDEIALSRDEAERYLRVQRRGSWLIAGGIFVVLLAVSLLIFFGDVLGMDSEVNPLPLAVFFAGIAVAVAMFIVGGMSMGRYEKFEGKQLRLDPAVVAHYEQLRERGYGGFVAAIVLGVLVIILAVGGAAVGGVLVDGGDASGKWLVGAMLAGIGLGVGILVISSMRRNALDRLTSEGDYRPENVKENELVSRIAGPYWLLALVVFLVWGFFFDGWDRSWMVWPIAGVLFALVAVTINSVTGDRERATRN